MMYRHRVADTPLYDAHIAGDGTAFHAIPRRVTACGIPFGRFDDPTPEGAPACSACEAATLQ